MEEPAFYRLSDDVFICILDEMFYSLNTTSQFHVLRNLRLVHPRFAYWRYINRRVFKNIGLVTDSSSVYELDSYRRHSDSSHITPFVQTITLRPSIFLWTMKQNFSTFKEIVLKEFGDSEFSVEEIERSFEQYTSKADKSIRKRDTDLSSEVVQFFKLFPNLRTFIFDKPSWPSGIDISSFSGENERTIIRAVVHRTQNDKNDDYELKCWVGDELFAFATLCLVKLNIALSGLELFHHVSSAGRIFRPEMTDWERLDLSHLRALVFGPSCVLKRGDDAKLPEGLGLDNVLSKCAASLQTLTIENGWGIIWPTRSTPAMSSLTLLETHSMSNIDFRHLGSWILTCPRLEKMDLDGNARELGTCFRPFFDACKAHPNKRLWIIFQQIPHNPYWELSLEHRMGDPVDYELPSPPDDGHPGGTVKGYLEGKWGWNEHLDKEFSPD